jgi:hypothetical protein
LRLFTRSHGLAIDDDDNLWATDVGAHVVVKLSKDGETLLTLGTMRRRFRECRVVQVRQKLGWVQAKPQSSVTQVEVCRVDREYDVAHIPVPPRSAHVSKLKERVDYSEHDPFIHASEGTEANTRYEEYVRALDELPVLRDVVREPPRIVTRNFRLGERPDVRRLPREDAYALREQRACEREQWYGEYAQGVAVPAKAGGKRKSARKPAQKKRSAKPRKRSQRSKVQA